MSRAPDNRKQAARNRHQYSCERKVKHPTKEEAESAAVLYRDLEAYQCLWCHFWHTGHRWGNKPMRA